MMKRRSCSTETSWASHPAMLLNLPEDSSSYNIKGHYVTMRRSLVYGTIRFRHNGRLQSTGRYTSIIASQVIHTKHVSRSFTAEPQSEMPSALFWMLVGGCKAKLLSNSVKDYVRRFLCIKHLLASRPVVSGPGSRYGPVSIRRSGLSLPIRKCVSSLSLSRCFSSNCSVFAGSHPTSAIWAISTISSWWPRSLA